MYITVEQMKARLESPNNIINVIRPLQKDHLTADEIGVPEQKTVPVKENLPDESNRARAARTARFNIEQHERHGEYTVNPNIGNDTVRTTIGLLSANGASSQSLQKEFGVTRNQVTSARKSKKLGISEKLELVKDRVSELALDRLMVGLGLISEEEIALMKPLEKSRFTTDMAKVVSSISGSKSDAINKQGINLTVVTPQIRSMEQFSVIDV
jgi:hypothetical protein